MSAGTIFLAGGGTGGHVFPAEAVAEALRDLADVEIVFFGTPRGIEARIIPAHGWRLELLDVEPMKGGGVVRAVRGALVAMRAMVKAFSLVRKMRPSDLLSVGGYAAGPVTLAAALTGVPVALLEPNSVVGLANRLLAPFARRAYVAWDAAAVRFPERARRLFGVPLRGGFMPKPYTARGTARVLVMGGSHGAGPLNDRMPDAISRLARTAAVEVVHQTGPDRDRTVRERYARAHVERVTVVPFVDDVAAAIADADVIVARAGAGTLAEITAIGRPAILVPYPHAADDHQTRNAKALAHGGGAVWLDQEAATAERLAEEIERLLFDESARVAMADASRAHGKPNAARDVAADLLEMAGIPSRARGRLNGAHTGPLREEEAR